MKGGRYDTTLEHLKVCREVRKSVDIDTAKEFENGKEHGGHK